MKFINLIALIICSGTIFAQELTRFTVKSDEDRIDAPVSVTLDGVNYNTDKGAITLYEILPDGEKQINCQLENGYSAKLWFIMNGITPAKSVRKFVLKHEPHAVTRIPGIQLMKDTRDLSMEFNGNPILSYRFATTFPPDTVSPLFKRSGFIHPLYSPGGEVLTRIQAPDHYHHYGIWGPWTKTTIEGREVDFWNLYSGQGTVQFAGFLQEAEGAVYSGFEALQQHIDFGAKGEDQIALNEILDVRAWNIGKGVWMVDYTTSINSPLKNGIMLDAYRYGGGVGFRATEKWQKDNCTVLTSENKTRKDADGSYARWCIVEGESSVKAGRSGILFMSHPANRMHPEPMRVWPLDANAGRGDMYFEFVPIRYESWKIEPKQNYTLKYRMIVFDGKMDAETAEKYWNSFSSMPVVTIIE